MPGFLFAVKMAVFRTREAAMKTRIPFLCVLALGVIALPGMAADPPPISVEGTWQCGPYTVATAKFTATGSNKVSYNRGGAYYDFAITTITTTDGTKTTLNTQTTGTWKQSGDLLQTSSTNVQVLSSDNPRYPVEAAQRSANEQLSKQAVAKNKIRIRSNSMTLRPINPTSKETDIDVVCRRL
jgi:hypothetical protein